MPEPTGAATADENAKRARGGILVFAAAIFLGAFLLFQVQPLIAKFILPWFGGSAGVWTTCMLFFQALLLGGYAYAHLSIKMLRPRTQAAVHVLLAAAALAMLPIIPAERWKPPGPDMPILRILLLLTMTLGLPYFVLSATAPLLQAWFARVFPERSPYRLYALSNFASLLALLSYPFVFEPLVSRKTLAVGWSVGMGVFVVIIAGCAVVAWRGSSEHQRAKPQDSGEHARRLNGTMTIFQCMLWLALPACGSLLLLATTNVISQEIAVVPFLWVLPLALYLLTFVIAFDSPRWYARTIFGPLLIAALAAVVWVMTPAMHHDTPSIVTQIAIYTAAMFVCCMVCHGEVARLKPDPRQLTSFYLCIAAGGAIGGFLVAVVAPMLLRGYHELHIGLFACPLLFMTVLFFDPVSRFHRGGERIGWYAMILGMIVLGLALQANANLQLQGTITLTRQRSFYGVLSVYEQRDVRGLPDSRLLHHGAITHGEQLLASGMQDHPTTYYGRESGVGQLLRLHADEPHPPRRIGAVGLGVGTIALYLQAGDLLRFYEIDPNVERLARQYFTFLDQAQGAVEIAMGDARLSMEREADQRYDLLVLDAFSGDAIPVHLLTREAFDVYLRHLEPGGIIAIHITNQHLDLVPVVARLAAAVEMPAVTVTYQGTPVRGEYESVWAILSRDTERLARLQGTVNVLSAGEDAPLWTDDFTSLFPLLK